MIIKTVHLQSSTGRGPAFGHCFALFHVHSIHAFASRCHASSQLHRILSTGKIIIERSVKQFSPTFNYCIGFTVLPRILVSVSSPTELAFLRSSCWRRNSASRFYTRKFIPIIFTNIFFKCSTINPFATAWSGHSGNTFSEWVFFFVTKNEFQNLHNFSLN